jgi:hypothetical protein
MGVAACADDLQHYSLQSSPQVNDIHEHVYWATSPEKLSIDALPNFTDLHIRIKLYEKNC